MKYGKIRYDSDLMPESDVINDDTKSGLSGLDDKFASMNTG